MRLKYNDKVHGYWLDGKRTKSVTGVAKLADDSHALDNWRKRMVLLGCVEQPDLLDAAAAALDDKSALDDLAERAIIAAGGTRKRDAGTAAHAITERHDAGEALTVQEQIVASSWRDALASKGFEIVPHLVERAVVFPDQRIVGRFDRMVMRPDGTLAILDLKTGASAVRYPHSTAIQLALYANAPLLAVHGVDEQGNFETEDFLPAPSVNKKVGYVVYMPEDGMAAVYSVNIALGWLAAQRVIFPGLRWRDVPAKQLIRAIA